VVARRVEAPISVGGRHGVATHDLFAKLKSGGSESRRTRKTRPASRADARERCGLPSSDGQEHPAGTPANAGEEDGTIQPNGRIRPQAEPIYHHVHIYLIHANV